MAKRKHIRKKQPKSPSKNNNFLLMIGGGILLAGLLAWIAWQLFSPESSPVAALAADGGNLEATSLEEGRNLETSVAEPATAEETRYLGPDTDQTALEMAEAGQLGQPALIFFHADW